MKPFQQALQHVAGDHDHGSGFLTKQIFRAVYDFFDRNPKPSEAETRQLQNQLSRLSDQLSSFRLVVFAIEKIISALGEQNFSTTTCLSRLDAIQKTLFGNYEYQARRLEALGIRNKAIIIHSHSTTIIACLSSLPRESRPGFIWQTESSPGMEGRLQARELAHAGYSVRLIPDTDIGQVFSRIDWVILGADSLGTSHFTNKIGSLNLALLAKEYRRPVYVLAHSGKYVPVPVPELQTPEAKSIQQKQNDQPASVLEKVPNSLVTEFILENSTSIPLENGSP
ncbi:MAG: hypothetical protein GXO90_09150 [FCB group bacterium]|nr:hypothetical protein [FCB group bacterium]